MDGGNALADQLPLCVVPGAGADPVAGVLSARALGAEVGAPYRAAAADRRRQGLAVGVRSGQAAKVCAITLTDAGDEEGHRGRRGDGRRLAHGNGSRCKKQRRSASGDDEIPFHLRILVSKRHRDGGCQLASPAPSPGLAPLGSQTGLASMTFHDALTSEEKTSVSAHRRKLLRGTSMRLREKLYKCTVSRFSDWTRMNPISSDASQDRPRTLAEAKTWMLARAEKQIHPMNNLSLADTAQVLETLDGLDGARWAKAWRTGGELAWSEAGDLVSQGQTQEAKAAYLRAHGYFFLGRFPCPNHPDKLACAVREREAYLAAGALFTPPVQRVSVPFENGGEVVFLYRRPPGVERPPVVIMWGGVDAWKEQMTAASDAVLARGVATIAMDGPGTGESPVKGVVDAERQFLPVMDWAARQADLAGAKVGLLGRSFGGYWATKLAHTQPDRIAGAVNWGGGAHLMFQKAWIGQSRHPDSYLMELVETRMRMLGAETEDEYAAFFERLSLLDQGLLDGPSAPLLLVNGRDDRQCPTADIDLLVEHGAPKSVRIFPGGHMGITPQTLPTIVDWLSQRVLESAR